MSQKRIYQSKYPYLITTNISGRHGLFYDNIECATILSQNIFYYQSTLSLLVYSYVIMPEHLHIIVKQTTENNISTYMQGVKYYTKKCLREQYEFDGTMWQKSFHDRIINTEDKFIKAVCYLKENPTKYNLEKQYLRLPYYYINTELVEAECQSFRKAA